MGEGARARGVLTIPLRVITEINQVNKNIRLDYNSVNFLFLIIRVKVRKITNVCPKKVQNNVQNYTKVYPSSKCSLT